MLMTDDDEIYMFGGIALLVVTVGIVGFDCVIYLKTGIWETTKITTFIDYTAQSSWIGLNAWINWFLQDVALAWITFFFSMISLNLPWDA
ncbi:MAG: hypothetical protein COA78_15085 [Blastopirellula sp.]|nr:MAG: hypothetical protein COA78_15085 [Blastopirellula sp.]